MEEQNNNITDQQIRELLKKRMLEGDELDPLAEQLLEEEAKLAFRGDILFTPSAEKEQQLLNRNGKYTRWYKKMIWAGVALLVVVTAFFIYKKTASPSPGGSPEQENNIEKSDTTALLPNASELSLPEGDTDTSKTILNKNPEGKVQVINTILKENADCGHAIYVTDSVVFSPHSPAGNGNELEIKDHAADDPMYFEEEHNTVWYKYVVPETGQLTFDIIPIDQNDDYDFMLYKWDGGDFRAKVASDKIKPVRACISRNDKKLKSMTGLWIDTQLPSYIHSGEGASYVRYIDVKKNDVFYLLVDNVYQHGNGHTVKFHIQRLYPGVFSVGQLIPLDNIRFIDGSHKVRESSKEGLDSLYNFLVRYPNLRIEIDGHVNKISGTGVGILQSYNGHNQVTPMQLSKDRANEIANYLTTKGVDPRRLTTKGYGETRPRIENPRTIKENIMNACAEIFILSVSYNPAADLLTGNK